jgi:hypothetical protein
MGEVQASDGGDLQAAGLGTAVAAVVGGVGDGMLRHGGVLSCCRSGLVGLDDQQVSGVLPLSPVEVVEARNAKAVGRPAAAAGRLYVLSRRGGCSVVVQSHRRGQTKP